MKSGSPRKRAPVSQGPFITRRRRSDAAAIAAAVLHRLRAERVCLVHRFRRRGRQRTLVRASLIGRIGRHRGWNGLARRLGGRRHGAGRARPRRIPLLDRRLARSGRRRRRHGRVTRRRRQRRGWRRSAGSRRVRRRGVHSRIGHGCGAGMGDRHTAGHRSQHGGGKNYLSHRIISDLSHPAASNGRMRQAFLGNVHRACTFHRCSLTVHRPS